MKKASTLLLFSLCFSFLANAQILERKGTFGAAMTNAEGQSGILIQEVIENTTASKLKLKANDILIEINDVKYTEVGELVNDIGHWRVDDPIKVKIRRNNKLKTFSSTIMGRPFEKSLYGEIIYGAVEYDGGMLRSILNVPEGVENPPVVFFLPGIGCGSLDYYYDETAPTKQLVEGLVKNGLAVYRVEKPGMGDSEGTKDCWEMDFQYEVDGFIAATKKLKTLPQIDAERVFLYGHSLGSVSAPLIGAEVETKGIICWGGVSQSWYEYELKRLRDQKVLVGWDYEEIEDNFRLRQSYLYDFFVKKMTPEELAQIPEYEEIHDDYFHNGSPLFYGLHDYSYLHQLNDVNFAKAWKATGCNVLALYGEYDIAAIDEEWAENISNIVNHYHPGMGSYKVVPNTNHHYAKIPSREEQFRLRNEGLLNADYRANNFNMEVVEEVSEWIKGVLDS